MELLEADDSPLTVHEDIIKYLREQDLLTGEDEEFLQNVTNFTEDNVREILEELLEKFENNQQLKEDYGKRANAHNQHELFDLKEILPDFRIDEATYDALTFRETLVVQRLIGDRELVPESVGGLCVDIQKAPGKPPERRLCDDTDKRLACVMQAKKTGSVITLAEVERHEAITCDLSRVPKLEDPLEVQADRSKGKFLVHLSSQFDYDGYNAGSSMTTWVDWNLHTLEEARREFYTRKVIKPVDRIEKVIKNTAYDSDDGKSDRSASLSRHLAGSSKKSLTEKSNKMASRESCKSIGRSATRRPTSSTNFRTSSQRCVKPKSSMKTPHKQSSRKSLRMDSKKADATETEANEETIEEMEKISKSLYVGMLKGFYYVKHVNGEENSEDRKFYSMKKAKKYISEGANFILMRYLAQTIFIGTFELSTMYLNGDMCRNIYNCTGPESQLVNNKRVDICRIYRTVIEESGIEHNCMTVLTLQGQIVTQTWEGTNYLLQVNPLLDVDNYKPAANEQILLKNAWESDMQLMSKYLDEKVSNELKIRSYMIDHPEFKNMVHDYIHAILLLKPTDIIEFTINHFLSFAPQFMPANDYFDR